MKQNRLRRLCFQVPFVANGQTTVDMPRGYDYESILVRLAGQLQVTTAGGTVLAEAPNQLIKRIEIIADGKNTLLSLPFNNMVVGNFSRVRAGVMTPPSSAAVGTYNVAAEGVYDFQTVDGIRPKDSNFRSAGLSLLQMRFTFGDPKDCFSGAAVATVAQNAIMIDVSSSELIEYVDPNNKTVTTPMFLKKTTYLDTILQASNANLQLSLPIGNLMRGVKIRTEVDGVPLDTILNNAILQSGVDVHFNMKAADIKAINKLDYGQNVAAGFYFCDLMMGGAQTGAKFSDAWDLSSVSEAKLTLDVSTQASTVGGAGVNKVTVEVIEYIPIAQSTTAKAA